MKFLSLYKKSIFIAIYLTTNICAFEYICDIETPNSVLNALDETNFRALAVNERKRYATCCCVTWFDNHNYLATVNLLGECLHTYKFDPVSKTVHLHQTITKKDGSCFSKPVCVVFSHDESLLAVANAKIEDQGINIYSVNQKNHMINPKPITKITHDKGCPHGIRFSADDQFIAAATNDKLGFILIWKKNKSKKELTFTLTQTVENKHRPLKPKGIDFTKDGKFVVIAYAKNAGSKNSNRTDLIMIHKFNADDGTIDETPICAIDSICFPEDVIFGVNDDYILSSNQGDDSISFHEFDKITGNLENNPFMKIQNPEGRLSFNHGISLSKTGEYLAVSNMGNDKTTIYKMD